MEKGSKVRVRIAPSPTGYLHIGTARTAFFNWLFARKHGGDFILRIEDTDLERSEKKYEEDIIQGLSWLGIKWPGEIFYQSKRLNMYADYLEILLKSGKAFWCYHTQEELESERKEQMAKKEAPRHICEHKFQGPAPKRENQPGIIRLAVDENSTELISFEDEIRGKIEWEKRLLGDFSLAKDLEVPLYNFAVVADDIDMKISHVIRGEDHISNTPKQLLIYDALGMKPPIFAHLPLILGSDKSKLSKRHGATAVIEYKKDYLPESLLNFMGYLGYTYSKEILTKEKMAEEFDLKKVHKSGAIFDVKKLNWINSQYIKGLDTKTFKQLAGIEELPDQAVLLVTERLEKLSDVSNFDYFWKEPKYDKGLLKWKKSTLEKSVETLGEVKKLLEKIDFKNEILRQGLDKLSENLGDRGLVYWPLRAALTGKEKSPDPVDIALALGKQKTLDRISRALEN